MIEGASASVTGGAGHGIDRALVGLWLARGFLIGARAVLASVAAFGRNLLDPRSRAPSARAGHAQAAVVRADVAAVWG